MATGFYFVYIQYNLYNYIVQNKNYKFTTAHQLEYVGVVFLNVHDK